MLKISQPDNFRRTAAGLCLILGPLLLLIGTAVTPATAVDTEPYLADLAESAGRIQAGTVLFVLGHMLLVPAVFGIVQVLRHRAVVLGHVAGALAAMGMVAFAGLEATRLYEVALAQTAGARQGAAVVEQFQEMAGFLVVLIPAIAGTTLGGLLLGVALWRAKLVPGWLPAALLAGFAAVNTGGDGTAVGVAGSALLAAAFGFVGLRLLTMSDQDWREGPAPDRPRLTGTLSTSPSAT